MFNTMTPAYDVGDVIEYWTGSTRRVLVEYREEDVKNGYPGFGGTCIEGGSDVGMSVWGYDDQITRVVRRAS